MDIGHSAGKLHSKYMTLGIHMQQARDPRFKEFEFFWYVLLLIIISVDLLFDANQSEYLIPVFNIDIKGKALKSKYLWDRTKYWYVTISLNLYHSPLLPSQLAWRVKYFQSNACLNPQAFNYYQMFIYNFWFSHNIQCAEYIEQDKV